MANIFIVGQILLQVLTMSGSQILYNSQEVDTVTECGGTISGSGGSIIYKYNEGEHYNDLDRCIWTIRAPLGTEEIQFFKHPTNFEREDWISVHCFSEYSTEPHTFQLGDEIDSEEIVKVIGNVCIVVFTSDYSVNGKGFRLDFEVNDSYWYPSWDSSTNYDFNTASVPGHLIYPGHDIDQYHQELSTFVISNGYRYQADKLQLWLQWYDIAYDSSCGYDALFIYKITRSSIRHIGTFCGSYKYSSYLLPFVGSDFILRFSISSEYRDTYKGFAISWTSIDSESDSEESNYIQTSNNNRKTIRH